MELRKLFFLISLPSVLAGKRYYKVKNMEWMKEARRNLEQALKWEPNKNTAKNVILVIGDGLGISTTTAARIYDGQARLDTSGEENTLSWDRFPVTGIAKTYSVDQTVTSSGSAATAMLTGYKTVKGVIGLSERAKRYDCDSAKGNELQNMAHWARDAGKAVGVVTNTRVTHATPACVYAHSAERYYEASVPDKDKGKCVDITQQFLNNAGDIQVMLGGGRRTFTGKPDPEYPNDSKKNGRRTDGRDLIQEWQDKQRNAGKRYKYVWKKDDFDAVDPRSTDTLLGLFEPNQMHYEFERENRTKNPGGEPHLRDMVRKAVEILQRDGDGFFLLVGGGRIDHAHHVGKTQVALQETVAMSEAVEELTRMTSPRDTLIIVTGDHSHTLTISGYAARGTNILGTQMVRKTLDNIDYHTLGYANGLGGQRNPGGKRINISSETLADWEDPKYVIPALVPLTTETHAGEDVGVYARGPWSHLLTGVYENNYIAHVMSYAACVGPSTDLCRKPKPSKPACETSGTAEHGLTVRSVCLSATVAMLAPLLRGT